MRFTRCLFVMLTIVGIAGAAGAQECTPAPAGMISWWTGDDNTSDMVGGNDASLINGVTFVPAVVGQGFEFTGVIGQAIDIPAHGSLEPPLLTFELWAIRYGPGQNEDHQGPTLFQQAREPCCINEASYGLWWRDSDGRISFSVGTNNGAIHGEYSANAFPDLGVPHHIAVSYDGAAANLYVNGQLEATRATSGPVDYGSGAPVTIGTTNSALRTNGWARTFNGIIDEVSFYSRALSSEEIQAIYEAGSGGKCATLEVAIDIKPGSHPNCFNVNGHGVIPVAILGSAEFDVDQIDAYSLTFDGMSVRVRGKRGPLCSQEDSNGDGYMDLVCHFEDDAEYWAGGNDEGSVTGVLWDGTEFEGTDSICIVP